MKLISIIALFPCLLFVGMAQGVEIQPGNWKVQMGLSMGGGESIPSNESTICLKDVSQMVNAGAGCNVNTSSTNGNHVSMNISCDVSGLKMDGTGDLTVSSTQVDGTLNLTMKMEQGPAVPTTSSLHAVRVGDCQQ